MGYRAPVAFFGMVPFEDGLAEEHFFVSAGDRADNSGYDSRR